MSRSLNALRTLAVCAAGLALAACGDDPANDDAGTDTGPDASDVGGDTPDGSGDDTGGDVGDAGDAGDAGGDYVAQPRAYAATVRYDTWGVPHILADDLPSAMFGNGYAYASHNVCILADQIVRARSERAAFFGPGNNDEHIDSDFGLLALGVYRYAEEGIRDLSPLVQDGLLAFSTGYNQWLEETGVDNLPELCRGADWVRPITDVDLYAYYLYLGERGSGLATLDLVATAQPPNDNKAEPPGWDALPDLIHPDYGSNGWGLGREFTETGRGMVFANPHFPWRGELTWYEAHLRVPDAYDVYGAALQGVAIPNIGFNEHLGWTHTVSAAPRFTWYRLKLNPDDPLQYEVDGQWRDMTSETFTIDVLQPDGSTESVERTMYRTHWGPMINAPTFGWRATIGFTMRNANENNSRMIEQWMRMGMATNLDEFRASHADVGGIPWVNTMYADADGNAWYTDSSAVPNLSEEQQAAYRQLVIDDGIVAVFADFGVILLDGTDSFWEWQDDPEARVPGGVPFSEAPQLLRDDYVLNANDSHWASHATALLEGYSDLYGGEQTTRSPRTRMNLRVLSETGEPGSYAGADGLWSIEELQTATLGNRGMMGELLLEDVLERCAGVADIEVDGETVAIADACAILGAWDGLYNLDSVGAIVFRELLGALDIAGYYDGSLMAVPFDPDDPTNTPAGLAPAPATGPDPILVALGTGVQRLGEAGLALNAPLGDVQFTRKGDTRFAIHGGSEIEGVTNIVTYGGSNATLLDDSVGRAEVVNPATDLTVEGYPMNYGASFLMTLAFTDDGPMGGTLLTYGESSDPASPHYDDQTQRFSDKAWRPILFTEADIMADPNLRVVELEYAP